MNNIKLSTLTPDPDNPRTISDERFAALRRSVREFPDMLCLRPIAVDANGVVRGGNMRYKALVANGVTEVPAEWVVRCDAFTPEDWRRFRVMDNEEFGETDPAKLLELYSPAELADWGFDLSALGDLANLEDATEGKTDEDATPPPPPTPVSVRGRVYALGRHRVMCGDSTSTADVARLLADEGVDLVVTDPPYNCAVASGCREEARKARKLRKDAKTIMNDSMSDESFRAFLGSHFTVTAAVMRPGASMYVFFSDAQTVAFRSALDEAGVPVRQELIWLKQRFVLSRHDYHYRTEPCLYGWKEGSAHRWFSDRKQSNVLEFPAPVASKDHPTMKPVAMIEYLVGNSSARDELVYDGFGGSGTTAIACEKAHRRARLMELDPRYCDVIRRRWAEFVHGDGCDWAALTPEVDS